GFVLDAADGTLVGRFESGPAPVFAGDLWISLTHKGVLGARSLSTGRELWRFIGDGHLTSAPIVVNGFVWEGSKSGTLYAIDAGTGQQVWSTDVGAPID